MTTHFAFLLGTTARALISKGASSYDFIDDATVYLRPSS